MGVGTRFTRRRKYSMAYEELEQFLGRGDERAVYLLSFKNIAGLVVGGIVGQQLGGLLVAPGLPTTAVALLGAVVGLILTVQYQGLVLGRRLLIAARFYLGRAVRADVIDAGSGAVPVVAEPALLRMRRADGTPLVVQRRVGARDGAGDGAGRAAR